MYLVDYRLGAHTGLELMREGFASRPCAPVIMLTGQPDYEIDLEATALGVTDFLVKQELDAAALERSIRYAISHQKAMRDLARSVERYALAVRAANDGIWDWDLSPIASTSRLAGTRSSASPRRLGDEQPSAWFDLVARRATCPICAMPSTRIWRGAPRISNASTGCATPTAAGAGL